MRASLPVLDSPKRKRQPKPPWLKVRAPGGVKYNTMKARARRLSLATVCEEAQCPNIGECWGGEESTATFMLMGEICTRGCRFCAVTTSRHPPALDPNEPDNVATAVRELGLSYVVLTSVNRDELSDGGAAHLSDCLVAIQGKAPEVLVEILTPDFEGNRDAVFTVARAPLAVFAHNVETVPRLTPSVRDPRASFEQSLRVLAYAKEARPDVLTKSSLMLGLGETEEELIDAMKALRGVGVDILTLGQYLQPSPKHLAVEAFITPERFDALGKQAETLGFDFVASGPLVRSSYRAGELYVVGRLSQGATP